MGLVNDTFNKLGKRFRRPSNEKVTMLGVSPKKYWRIARNRLSYLKGQLNLLESNDEVLVVGDHEYGEKGELVKQDYTFHDQLQAGLSDYITVAKRMFSEQVIEVTDFEHNVNLFSKTPRSIFNHIEYYKTMKGYDAANKRTNFERSPESMKLYFQHVQKTYVVGYKMLIKQSEKVQTDLLKEGIITGTSSGWDLWQKQSKDKFPDVFKKFCKTHLGIKVDFTVFGVLDAVAKAISINFYPPYTGFSRTQGGSRKKVRVVFGGNILAKAAGALLSACKKLAGVALQRTGHWR